MALTQFQPRSYRFGRRDHDRGLTLIELLVVVVVLGILSAVVVLAVAGLREETEDSACPADFRNLLTATESYFVRFNSTTIPQVDATPDGFEKTLVNAGLVREVSRWYDLDADGELLLPAGSPCSLT